MPGLCWRVMVPSGPMRFRVMSVSGGRLWARYGAGAVDRQILYLYCSCGSRRQCEEDTLTNPPADLFNMVRRMHPEWTSPFVFRRQLIRTNLPSSTGTATGVHYDHIFLRDGPPTALTAWVPIGDCSPINGGLMYLEDSVGVGKAIEEEFTRRGKEKGFSKEDATYAFNSNVGAPSLHRAGPINVATG